ncbi:MAG: hypothetical protein FWD34_05200 [Oscillospiraceae bacterium]|nr:hypothetical protein [Oscillospiraceae bacterium]
MTDNKIKKINVFDFRALLKNDKAVKIIILGGVALVLLIFMSDFLSGTSKNQTTQAVEVSYEQYEKRLEKKLSQALAEIDGVGEFTVIITLDSLSETVYSERGGAVKTVITPKVRGVAIICEGGDDIYVKQKIVEMTSKVLGIGTNKICVTN